MTKRGVRGALWSCSGQWCALTTQSCKCIQLPILTLALALQWTQKLALAAFLHPLVSVFLSTRHGQQRIIKPLRRCFRMSEVPTLDLDTQWAMVLSQLELLMCIGPLVPLLLPLGPPCLLPRVRLRLIPVIPISRRIPKPWKSNKSTDF